MPALLTGGADPRQDALAFQLAQLACWLMAATDGHAKNHSIFLQPGDTHVMTPLYDILSMWPYFGKGPNQYKRRQAGLAMAMRSKNVHHRFDSIQTRHWHQLAMKNGGLAVWGAMVGLVEKVGPSLAAVEARLPKFFHGRLWAAISKGMMAESERFLGGQRTQGSWVRFLPAAPQQQETGQQFRGASPWAGFLCRGHFRMLACPFRFVPRRYGAWRDATQRKVVT